MKFNPIFTKIPPHPKSAFLRAFASRAGRVQKGCECPEPPPYKIVQEKSCKVCSFLTWKPKTRRCVEHLVKKEVKEDANQKPKKCFAGMVIERPFSACTPADFNPFKKKPCMKPIPPPKIKPPPPPEPPIPIPKATWQNSAN